MAFAQWDKPARVLKLGFSLNLHHHRLTFFAMIRDFIPPIAVCHAELVVLGTSEQPDLSPALVSCGRGVMRDHSQTWRAAFQFGVPVP